MARKPPIRKDTSSGRYIVVVDVARPGEPRKQRKKRFDTYKEALSWYSRTIQEVQSQTYVSPQKVTLTEHIEAWLPVLKTTVRASTAASYERNLRLHVLPYLGSPPVQALRPSDFTALYATLMTGGKMNGHRERIGGLSRTTVAYIHTIVGKAMEAAVADEIVQTNVVRRATPPKAENKVSRHDTMRTWSKEQLQTFLTGSATHQHHAVWTLLATTGLRRGEALGLGWNAVDLDAGRLTVMRSLVDVDRGTPVFQDPKTREGRRSVALDARTVAVIRAHKATQAKDRLRLPHYETGPDLVFARADGAPIHPDRFSRSFQEQVKRLGLPVIRLHDLRHTWATLALQGGINPKVVQERLGHSKVTITLDIYSHVVPAMASDAADRVAAMIFGA